MLQDRKLSKNLSSLDLVNVAYPLEIHDGHIIESLVKIKISIYVQLLD